MERVISKVELGNTQAASINRIANAEDQRKGRPIIKGKSGDRSASNRLP
jgi:hypothetical protein